MPVHLLPVPEISQQCHIHQEHVHKYLFINQTQLSDKLYQCPRWVQLRSTCISSGHEPCRAPIVTPKGICTHLLKLSTPPFHGPLNSLGRKENFFFILILVRSVTKTSKAIAGWQVFSLYALYLSMYRRTERLTSDELSMTYVYRGECIRSVEWSKKSLYYMFVSIYKTIARFPHWIL